MARNDSAAKRKADYITLTQRVIASLAGIGATYDAPALATLGEPVPFLIGTALLAAPNVTWVGNSDLIKETYTLDDFKNGNLANAIPVEADYSDPRAWETYINATWTREIGDYQIPLASGPGVRLRRIMVGKRTVWNGDATGVFDIPRIVKSVVDIKKGVRFYDGADNQPVDPNIQKSIPQSVEYVAPIVPNYGGVSYVVLKSWDRQYSLDGIAFEIQRFPNPLNLAPAVNTNGTDVNLMTILVEALTSEWNNPRYVLADFDHVVLTAIAETLASEGNFGTLLMRDKSITVADLAKIIEDQADGKFFQDPYSGKLTFALLRDEDHADMSGAVLDIVPSMIKELQIDKSNWVSPTEAVTVEYQERRQDYKKNVVTARTSFNGSTSTQSEANSNILLPLVNDGALAAKIASRILALKSVAPLNITVEMDRNGARVLPGSVVTLTWPQHNIPKTAFFVTQRSDLSKIENRSILELTQVSRVDITAIFPAEEPVYEVEPLPIALPPRDVRIMDAPYPFALGRLRKQVPGFSNDDAANNPGFDFALNLDVSVPFVLAAGQNKYQIGWVAAADLPTDVDQTIVDGFHDYQSQGVLINPVSKYDGFDDGVIPSIVVQFPNIYEAKLAAPQGSAPDWSSYDASVIYSQINTKAIFINDEILSFHGGFTIDEATATVTFKKVDRALFDTVAATHNAGSKVWVRYGNWIINTGDARYEHTMKMAFNASEPRKDWDFFGIKYIAEEMSDEWFDSGYKPGRRYILPNRPADTRINNVRSGGGFLLNRGGNYSITWKIRPRWRSDTPLTEDMSRPLFGSATFARDAVTDCAYGFPQTYPSGFFAMNEWDWLRGEWCRFRVKLQDYWDNIHDLGSIANYRPEALNVTIPAGAAAGPGKLWVSAENFYGSSDEFAIDWLPITVAGTIIEKTGYGRKYGAHYGG